MRSRATPTSVPEVKVIAHDHVSERAVRAPSSRDEDVSAVGVVQDRLGNTWLNDALAGPGTDPLSALVVGELGLTTVGVATGAGFIGAGNEAVIAAMQSADALSAGDTAMRRGSDGAMRRGSDGAMRRGSDGAMRRGGSDDVQAGPAVARALAGSGGPLPSVVLGRMEAALGHDLSHVRIHTGIEADRASAEIQARAFAIGADLFFAQGEYRPGTRSGDELLAHELTHVVQHDEGRLDGKSGVSSPHDVEEREADAVAARVVEAMAGSAVQAHENTEIGSMIEEVAPVVAPESGLGESNGSTDESVGQAAAHEPAAASSNSFAARKEADPKTAPAKPVGALPTNGVTPKGAATNAAPTNGVTVSSGDKPVKSATTPTGGSTATPPSPSSANVKELVATAVAKAPAAIKSASSALTAAEKKVPHGADDIKSRLPALLKQKLKPLMDPLAPKAPGESVAKEALSAVVSAAVNTLPDVAKQASHDADAAREQEAKDAAATGDKAGDQPTAGKGAPKAAPPPKPVDTAAGPGEAAKNPANDAGKKNLAADGNDETTQFFITVIAEAISALIPAPIPAGVDDELDADGKVIPKAKAKKLGKDGKPIDDAKIEPAKKDGKAKGDDLAAKKKDMDAELVRLKDAESRARIQRDELSAKIADADKHLAKNRHELEERKQFLDHEAAKAKKAKKEPRSANKDTHFRQLQRAAKALPKEIAALKEQLDRAEKELADAETKRLKEEQDIRAVEAEMQAAQRAASGGGGGVHIPPPTDEVETAKKVLAAIKGKGEKIDKEAVTAKKTHEDLQKEVKDLEKSLADTTTELDATKKTLETKDKEILGIKSRISSRKSELSSAPPPADGSPAPTAANDSLLARLNTELQTAITKRKEVSARHKKAGTDKTALEGKLEKKKLALEEAAKKLKEADTAKVDYAKALESLNDPLGCPIWQKIATEYKVDVKAVPFAAGMTRDETGALIKIADLKKKKEETPPQTEEEKKKAADAAAKKKKEDDAEEAKLTDVQKKERADKKKKDEADRLHAEISNAKDKPKAERDAALEAIAKAQGKKVSQIEAEYNAKITSAKKPFVAGMSKDDAKKAGISDADFALLTQHTNRDELQKKAAKTMGVASGQDAVDALWAHARQRGLNNPGEMLKHLAYADVNSLPKEFHAAALRAHADETARIGGLTGSQKEAAENAKKDALKAAAKSEAKFVGNKEIAAKLDCSIEEAAQYVKSVQNSSGCSEDEAMEALKVSKGKPGTPSPETQKKLQEIHLLPPGPARKAALLALAKEIGDPKMLAGAALAPEKGDGVVIKGDVANAQLNAQLKAVDGLPADQQWEALCNISKMTGTKVNDLERARRNLAKRNDIVNTITAIESDETITSDEKKKRLDEIAATHKVSVDQLKEFGRVERNKAGNKILGAIAKDKDLQKELDKLNLDNKKTPGDREIALQELANRTGVPLEDIKNWNSDYEFRQKKLRWKNQFKSQSEEEAADKMAGLVQQYGSSDAAKEHLRNCPPDKLPLELRGMKADLLAWDAANPGKEVKEKLKRVDPDTDKAYQKKRDALMSELNSRVYVKDTKALALLQALGPEERAALLRDRPDVMKKFFNGVDGDTSEGTAAAALFGQAKANNLALNKEAAEDADKAKKASEVEERVQAARDAALALNMPFKEAKAHLQAVADGNAMSPQQALAWLKAQPGGPAAALQAAYATKPDKNSPEKVNPVLRARLDQIENLPPKERGEAFKALKELSKLDDDDMDKALTVVRRDNSVTMDMHALRDLPQAEREAALKDLAAKYKVKDPKELEAIYQKQLERTASRLSGLDVLPKGLSLAPEDVDKHVKELALKSGQSEASIRRLVEARRSEAFSELAEEKLGGKEKAEAFKKGAADQGMTPTEYADWLARAPATMLPADQQALKAQLQAGGYKIVRSEAELAEMKRAGLIADPNNVAYRESAAKLTAQLQSGHCDKDILTLFGQMSPAEQKLFREEYLKETGKTLHAAFENSLSGGDEASGLRMLKKARLYNQEEAEKAFGAVDPKDPAYAARRDMLTAELVKGADASATMVAALLIAMPLNQRALFMKEYGELRTFAPQSVDMTDTKKRTKFLPPDLKILLGKNPEALAAINQGMVLSEAATPQKDVERTRRVRESIDIGKEAAAELGVDPRVAFKMVEGLAKDSGMSPRNALNFLTGKPVVDDSDKRSEFVKRFTDVVKFRVESNSPQKPLQGTKPDPTDKIGGQTLDKEKVNKAERFFDMPFGHNDAQVLAYIQGCNPRELAELDKRLQARTPKQSLAEITKGVDGTERKELGAALRGMEDFQTTSTHYQLIKTVKETDPRRTANVKTPGGFAERLAWCKDLPPELRVKELDALRTEAGNNGFGSKEVMSAWLNGPQGRGKADDPSMLSSAMQAQLADIERLPSKAAREKALEDLARLTGRWQEDPKGNHAKGMKATERAFAIAKDHTAQGLEIGKKMQDISGKPEGERQQAILDLANESKLGIDDLHKLQAEAVKAGLVVVGPEPVKPEVAKRLNEIRALPVNEQGQAIRDLQTSTGLSVVDINAHLQSDLDTAKKFIVERQQQFAAADSLKEKIASGNTEAIKREMDQYKHDPAMLKKIMTAYGPELEADLVRAFGERPVAAVSPVAALIGGKELGGYVAEKQIDFRLITEQIAGAREHLDPPKLPEGVSAAVSDEVRRIRDMKLPPDVEQDKLEELRCRRGLVEGDFAVVLEHAAINQKNFDATVERKIKLLEREKDTGIFDYVKDANVMKIIGDIPPEMLAAMEKRCAFDFKLMGLFQNIQGGMSGDDLQDFQEKLRLGKQLEGLPVEDRAKATSDARVEYKTKQLTEEFDDSEDVGRIAELLRDCTPEELKALDLKFGGKLQEKIAKAQEPSFWGTIGRIGLVMFAGPVAASMLAASEKKLEDELKSIKIAVKDATFDPTKPWEADRKAIDKAKGILKDEFGSWWTRDSNVIGALKGLSPKDLAQLQKEWDEEKGAGSLEKSLRNGVSGEDLCKSIAMLREAEDAAAGIDRGQQLKDTARQMAIKEVMADLKKNPKNRDKTDSELYQLAQSETEKIAEKTQAKIKKIRDGANDIFKAIDGWGDNEDALNKALCKLTPEESELVRIEYRRHFGKDLDTNLTEDLGGKDLQVAQELMSKEKRVEGLRHYVLTMSGSATVEMYMSGDSAGAGREYAQSWGGLGEDEEGIYAAFEAMTPEERTKVCQGAEGEAFLNRVKKHLGTNEAAVVDALTAINPESGVAEANPAHVAAAKIQIHSKGSGDWDFWSGWGTKEEEIVQELDKLTPEQVREACKWYEKKFGTPLAYVLADELGQDTREFAIVDAEMRGDKVEADVHRLKWAAQDENDSTNWLLAATGPLGAAVSGGSKAMGYTMPVLLSGTDEELLEKTLKAGKEGRGGRDKEHLEKVKARFNSMFADSGSLGGQDGTGRTPMDMLIDNETSGVEKAYFSQLVQKGEADPELELVYSMAGWGTDEDRAKKVLEDMYSKTPEERENFKRRFAQMAGSMYGGTQSLDQWLEDDFSGTEGFEMKLLAMGKPSTPEEMFKVAKMRWEFERGGAANGFMNGFMDGLGALGATSAGEVFERDSMEMFAMFDENGKLKSGVNMDRLEEISEWQGMDAKNYRETRDAITDTVVNVVQVVGAVAIACIPGLQGVSAMIIANLVLAAATMGLKAMMKGNGFGWEEGMMDLAMAAVSAATAGVGAKLQTSAKIAAMAAGLAKSIGKAGAQKIIAQIISEAIGNGLQGFLNAALTSEDAMRKGDGAFFKHLLGGALSGAAQGAAGAVGKGALSKTGLGKAIDEVQEGAFKGGLAAKMGLRFADGLISSSIQTAADVNQWEAWAAGKGLSAETLRGVFLQGIAQSVMGTALEGSMKRAKLQGAIHEVTVGRERLAHLEAAMSDAPVEHRPAMLREYNDLMQHIHEQKSLVDLLHEDAKQEQVKDKQRDQVEQKIQKPLDPSAGGDPVNDAARRLAVEHALDATAPGKVHPGDPTDHVELARRVSDKDMLDAGRRAATEDIHSTKPPAEGHVVNPTDKIEAKKRTDQVEADHARFEADGKAIKDKINELRDRLHKAKPDEVSAIGLEILDQHDLLRAHDDAREVMKKRGAPKDPAYNDDPPPPGGGGARPPHPPDDPPPPGGGGAVEAPAKKPPTGVQELGAPPPHGESAAAQGPIWDELKYGAKKLIGKNSEVDDQLIALKRRMREPGFEMPGEVVAPVAHTPDPQQIREAALQKARAAITPTDGAVVPGARQDALRDLVGAHGNYMDARLAVNSDPAVRDMLTTYRLYEVNKLVADLHDTAPGIKVKATLDHATGEVVISFDGGRTELARDWMKHVATERFGMHPDKALGVRIDDGPVVVTPGASLAGNGDAHVVGKLHDPIVAHADGRPIMTSGTDQFGYSTQFGFHGTVAADGAYEIRRTVVLKQGVDPNDPHPMAADLHASRADTLRAVQEIMNAPQHRIVVDGVERVMRVAIDVQVFSGNPSAHPGDAHVLNVYGKAGRADSSNIYAGGRNATDSPEMVRATTAHELAHAVLGLGDNYQDDYRPVRSMIDTSNGVSPHLAPDLDTDVRSHARRAGGEHDIPGASLMDGASPHIQPQARAIAQGETWESIAIAHRHGIRQAMAESGLAIPQGPEQLHAMVRYLQLTNEHISGNAPGGALTSATRPLTGTDQINVPREVPHPLGSLHEHQLRQIEWAIEQTRRSPFGVGDATYTQGGGGEVDQMAAKAIAQAGGRERFLRDNPGMQHLAAELPALEAAHLADTQKEAATRRALGMHHSEWANDPVAQKLLFDASGEAVDRMKASAALIVKDMPGVEVSSLRKRNDLDGFVAEVIKKQTSKGYAEVGEMSDIIRGRFNVDSADQMAVVAQRLQDRFGGFTVEVKPPRDGYPRWHVCVADPGTGLVHEWQIGTKATTDFFERKSLKIPEGITSFKGAPDFHDGVYKLLDKIKDPDVRAQYGIDEMMPHYKKLTEETGTVTADHPFPKDYEARYQEMASGINAKLAAIEADRPGYMNDVLDGKIKPKPAASEAPAPLAPIRTANEAAFERRQALGPEFSEKFAEVSRGIATAQPGSPAHDGFLSRMLDLDAIARNPNANDAKAQLEAIRSVDTAAMERPTIRANASDATEAKALLRANPEAEIAPYHAMALLDDAIGTSRITKMAQSADGVAEAHAPIAHAGEGGPAQRRVAEALSAMGVPADHLTFHNTAESSTFTAAPDHHFTVARMPDGRLYLVDPTFGQFLSTGNDMVGRRLLSDPHGASVAHGLSRDGYVLLDDATARTYGRALTGHDVDFSAADFTRPNGTRPPAEADNLTPEQHARAKKEYESALKERGSGRAAEVADPTTPAAKPTEISQAATAERPAPEKALAMHHSEFATDAGAQESLFKASAGAVDRMKAAGADIVKDMTGAEVSSLRKRNTLEEFTSEVLKKQKNEGYEHIGKMCDIVRGRFNVESGSDVDMVVARLKEKFGDDVVKVKAPRDGYPRWHINVLDANTGLVHEWQVGTKATTSFFETKSLAIPASITAFKGAPDFHDGVYKLLNKIADPEVRARYGIDEMLPGYKALAEATGKVTHEQPFPEGYTEKYKEMTKAINDKLVAIERDTPGYMNHVLTGEPLTASKPKLTEPTPDGAPPPPKPGPAERHEPHTPSGAELAKPTPDATVARKPTAERPAAEPALAMHHSEFAKNPAAQESLFKASEGAVERMKSAGADIAKDMPGAEVSSLRKRNTLEEFTSEVIKKQKNEGYEHVGKMCDIVRGRFNVESGSDVDMVVARLKEKFGDDVVKVKPPRDGYPRWHINVVDATTGLVHEWQVGTKATTSFFETKSLAIPESITAFKGAPDFHDGVYKLLNKISDPEIRAKYGIDEMLPGYKALAEATGKTTSEHPFPEGYAEKYKEMTKAINDKLKAIESDTPGYMNHVLTGEPLAAKKAGPTPEEVPAAKPALPRTPRPQETLSVAPGIEVASMHEFQGRVLVQYKNGGLQWMEPAQAAKLRVAQTPNGVPVATPTDKTLPIPGSQQKHDANKTLPMPVGGAEAHNPRKTLPLPENQPNHQRKTQPMEAVQPHAEHRAVQQAAGGQRQQHAGQQQAIQMPAVEVPKPGSQHAVQAQKVYANGSNTEFVHVDLERDPALRRVLDKAHGATAAGKTLDEKLALLAAHVKDGITYDMGAQQNEYRNKGGNVGLGQMIEQGSVVCREKALFTHAALAEMGIKSKVVVGTVPDGNGATGGHAWVELPNGTIIDGTWGRIFPAGMDPVQGRTRRNEATFAEPRFELPGGDAAAASAQAARILATPSEMDRMRRPQHSPEEALVRPGVRAWHPDGRSPVTVEYSERNKVQVKHDDGRVEILDRAAFVKSNPWALQQGAGQQQQQRTHTMAGFVPHPDIDAAGPDDRALSLMDARVKNQDLDKAVHAEVQSLTKRGSGGEHYVDETYENVTVGAGFAGISNEVSQKAEGKAGKRLVIGEENPWMKAKADLGQPAGESEVPGGQHGMKDTAQTADERFMHAREHAENAEINRSAAGVGLLKKKILGVELPPEPMDSSWHRPDAKARIAVLEGSNPDGTPIIRYIYAKRVDICSGPGPARKLADKAQIRGRGPVPDNMSPAELDRLTREGKIIPRQIDPELYQQLLAEKRIMQSDQAFDASHLSEGDKVLVYGAGASAAWGVEGAYGKASSVEWIGRMAKPGDDLTSGQNARIKQHYLDLEAAKAANDPIKVERAMKAIERFTFTEAPNNGFLPRNLREGGAFDPDLQADQQGKITRDVIDDLKSVTRDVNPETGKSMLRIEAADGTVKWCDRLVLAIGQDGAAAGGPGKILEKVPVLHPLVDSSGSNWAFPVVVGLQSPDSAIRVLGVAATSPVLRKKIESGSKEFVEQSFAMQAKDKATVPLDSQGVIGSFHHAERMIRSANKQQLMDYAKATPEQQQEMMWEHLGYLHAQKAEDELKTTNAPALPQSRRRHAATTTDSSDAGDPARAK